MPNAAAAILRRVRRDVAAGAPYGNPNSHCSLLRRRVSEGAMHGVAAISIIKKSAWRVGSEPREGEPVRIAVRFWLVLLAVMLSLTAASAQNAPGIILHGLPELTPEQEAYCKNAAIAWAKRSRECDNNRGCFFDDPPDKRELAQSELQCRLQLHAAEAQKKLDAQRQAKPPPP